MKIFLSWSGDRSKAVATALRNWLPLVLHYAKPWLSQQDIQAGDRWSVEVGNELNESHFGIICLTPENKTKPWIMFEAGAISKSFSQGAVCPYLYGVDHLDVIGPLQQFQGKKADCSSTKELVEAINSKSTTPVDPNTLDTLFETLWPRLESLLSNIPVENIESPQPRSQPEVLEDLVKSVRAMENRLRKLSNQIAQSDEAVGIIGRADDDAPHIKFVIIAAEAVGTLKIDEKFSLQGPPTRLISAIASRAGLSPDDYGTFWSLRDAKLNYVLTQSDILEHLGDKYRERTCMLKIEHAIPF